MGTIRGSGQKRLEGEMTPRVSQALTAFKAEIQEDSSESMWASHKETEELRYLADRYRRRKPTGSENSVNFQMDEKSGKIFVHIVDSITGELKLKMTPEQVERVLQNIEESEDNECTLSSFFIDLTIN